MTEWSVRLSPSGMKEGWSGPSRGALTLVLTVVRGRSTPAIFRRSLSPHSLRDVSKPRGHSTQPLLLQHVQDCIQAPALSPHSKGDIRTAPPSRSRVIDYIHTTRNVVKRKMLPRTTNVMAGLGSSLRSFIVIPAKAGIQLSGSESLAPHQLRHLSDQSRGFAHQYRLCRFEKPY